ncbi:hypothetical protein B0T25DRAFT_222794 [Lasiosphaeria hispida]|uniref:Uncharacterized protein n=1 Tax=Lasiosphaeria hispida TaxID=260671 RepID=A0AAJ0MEV7_9PEZI|nr:hypothetical protein B0T25DRAFT_222794 [Lasiosphaeria hispida]
MSYQEYAQFGKNTQRNRDAGRAPPRLRTDRPYTGSMASFSVPRQTPPLPLHSTSSSTSSASLSPSNSASQKLGDQPPNSPWGNGTMPTIKQLELGAEKPPDLLDVPMPWRPFYLQRKILASFAVVFAGLTVGLEALYGYSDRNQGLGAMAQAGQYLWRFAPVALLTLVTALWNRVEYQAKFTAPWLRLSKGPAAVEKTLLLDYVAMSQPWSVLQAAKNKDSAVVFATIVSMMLKVSVLLSTALMAQSLLALPGQSTSVTLETSFVDNAANLAKPGALAFYTMVGLQQDDVLFPDGVSTRFAYQTFSQDVPRGIVVNATVDGLSAGLECEVARLGLAGVEYSPEVQTFGTSFSTAGCNITMPISSGDFFRPVGATGNQTFYFARFGEGSCGNSSNVDDKRMVVVFGTENINARSLPTTLPGGMVPVNGTIARSASLFCKPTYSISRVDVSKRDDVVMSINPSSSGRDRALSNVGAWGIAEAFFASFQNELADTFADATPWFYQPGVVNVDSVMYLALDFQFRTTGSPATPEALLDPNALQGLVTTYFQQYIPLLASRSLTETASSPAPATANIISERFMVVFLPTQMIVVHLAISTFLAIAMLLLVPKKGFLPRDPGTIMDTAALIANSRGLLQTLRGVGGGSEAMLKERLLGTEFYTGVEAYERAESGGSGYFRIFNTQGLPETTPDYVEPTDKFPNPILLHPVSRLTALLVAIGFIIGLDLTLQFSQKNGGFDDADDNPYRHLLQTVLPAQIFGFLTLYFVAAGFATRSLAPYLALSRGATFEQSISLNLVDKAFPVVLLEAIKSRNLAVGGASVAAFVSALFTIFAASLFTIATVPVTASCQLLSQDFFSQSNGVPDSGFCTTCQNGTVLASLVLNGNISYPQFTYEELVFPSLGLASIPEDMRDLPDDIVISATIPAVRSVLACRKYQQSELAINLTVSSTLAGTGNPLRVTIPGQGGVNQDNSIVINTGLTLDDLPGAPEPPIDPNAFFGAGAYKPITIRNATVSRWIWVWGQLQNAGTNLTTVKSALALTCNETILQLSANVRFIGGNLDIDQTTPPVRDDSTLAMVPVAIDGNLNYDDLVKIPTPHLLDPFFTSLVSSRFAIPLSDLGSAAALGSVSGAIDRQHTLIRAQIVNMWNRRPTTPDTAGPALFPLDTDGAIMGNASVAAFPARLTVDSLDSGAARRIVQDAVATRVLQALLAAALVFSAASWLALPRANVLPRVGAGSIAGVAALLADGNIFGLMGRGAEWQGVGELHAYFRDGLHVTMGFQMGWEMLKRRRREETLSVWGMNGSSPKDQVFAVSAIRTGGWGGGEAVGLGLQARVGYAHRDHVRDWGWRT